jgi:primosomal protein N' (replication factor Y)
LCEALGIVQYMPPIAKVVVEISLNREFDYKIPVHLQAVIQVGSQVQVPFHGRELRGFVVGFAADSAHTDVLKEIDSVIGEVPLIPDRVMKLAYWIAEYYCAPIEQAVRTVLPSAVRKRGANAKQQLTARLRHTPERALPAQQQRVVDLLRERGVMSLRAIKEELTCSDSPIRSLEKKEILVVQRDEIRRNPFEKTAILPTQALPLMEEQAIALERIKEALTQPEMEAVLLEGVTGSGKTEVYLQAIEYVRQRGEGAIVLVPEIALTPQTVERFRARFGEGVAVLHSALSEGERHDEWHRIRRGEASIVVGARSALFAPLEQVGILIVDEEHEPTYKQDESPRYHARDVALMRGRLERCAVVLGSATPSFESYRNVSLGRYRLAQLTKRVDDRNMPMIRAVDMGREIAESGQPTLFSKQLVQGIYDRLDRKEQIILFLNRRGFASTLQCEACGYIKECQACAISMTYHKKAQVLRCHMCGAQEDVPKRCPQCNKPSFSYSGSGTEKMEEVLAKLFPKARMARMDSDTMRRKEAYQEVLGRFRSGKIDLLIGTQMIAKGLDFPNVTLVGVLNADLSLYMPDFRAGERTFQLLTQVAGRAGRGDVAGEVIIQTYSPQHPAIQSACSMDQQRFVDEDMVFRKEMNYPPFSHLLLVTFRGLVEQEVAQAAESFEGALKQVVPAAVRLSPAMPSPLARAKGFYRYQVMLRCEHTIKMTRPVEFLLSQQRLPKGVQVTLDVDALSLM